MRKGWCGWFALIFSMHWTTKQITTVDFCQNHSIHHRHQQQYILIAEYHHHHHHQHHCLVSLLFSCCPVWPCVLYGKAHGILMGVAVLDVVLICLGECYFMDAFLINVFVIDVVSMDVVHVLMDAVLIDVVLMAKRKMGNPGAAEVPVFDSFCSSKSRCYLLFLVPLQSHHYHLPSSMDHMPPLMTPRPPSCGIGNGFSIPCWQCISCISLCLLWPWTEAWEHFVTDCHTAVMWCHVMPEEWYANNSCAHYCTYRIPHIRM